MRTHVERDADSKARQGTPAGSATAGVNVIFFIVKPARVQNTQKRNFFSLFFWLLDKKFKSAKHQKNSIFWGGALSLSQYLGTHTCNTMACTQPAKHSSTCV
jgi:hypothetical protein